MAEAITTISNIVHEAPKYLSLAGLTVSVICFAATFFQSFSAFMIYGFFTTAFAIATYREYTALDLREINDQLRNEVGSLSTERQRLSGEVTDLHEANEHLGENVDQLRGVREQIHTGMAQLNWIGGMVTHVTQQLFFQEWRLGQTTERLHTLIDDAAAGRLALPDTHNGAIVRRV
ncbi:MAG: hypothetical protein SP1CHLAM54_00400 [Chlamydiia bacterium]|nr:hypothetical protein [Chlamydiia bacterium]MCH9614962.1 hypothetical protein [Chlamydiia bacterium]MCH9629988.1 hypothetical protein [Chlamydiia bacterium]